MNQMRKFLSCALVVCMLCAASSVQAEEAVEKDGTIYSMEIVLDETTSDNPSLKIKMDATVYNDSEDEWSEICFRDYMSSLYQWFMYNHEGENLTSGITRAACGDTELNLRVEGVRRDQPHGPRIRRRDCHSQDLQRLHRRMLA